MKIWFSNLIWKIKHLPRTKKIIILIIILVFIVLLVAIYYRYFQKEKPTTTENNSVQKIEETKVTTASLLDGTKVSPDLAKRIPLGVIVENHPDARPQAGLDKASIIYEAIAEGGITRFLAIYGPQDAGKVGPVRSARTYFVSWSHEWKALFGHVGGNIDALDLLASDKSVYNLDQFSIGSQAYWREALRRATEHTMFTDTSKLRKVALDKKYPTEAQFSPNTFKAEADTSITPQAQIININFSTASYAVKWTYNKTNNDYLRFMAGTSHKDAVTGTQLAAKNIIIQYVDRKNIKTRINEDGWIFIIIGQGKAKFIQDGVTTDCTWKRADIDSRTKFYDTAGNEMKYNPGTTWYEIVHPDTSVTIQ